MKLHFPAVFLWGGEKVVSPDGRLFNTRYTEETHSKNSAYREFCAGKTRAGGIYVISFKHLSLPPAGEQGQH